VFKDTAYARNIAAIRAAAAQGEQTLQV
jgi:hypothetical protein